MLGRIVCYQVGEDYHERGTIRRRRFRAGHRHDAGARAADNEGRAYWQLASALPDAEAVAMMKTQVPLGISRALPLPGSFSETALECPQYRYPGLGRAYDSGPGESVSLQRSPWATLRRKWLWTPTNAQPNGVIGGTLHNGDEIRIVTQRHPVASESVTFGILRKSAARKNGWQPL
jgi:hypothetical protein